MLCCLCFTAADQTKVMQDQMSGAAMSMPPDPTKAFKVRTMSQKSHHMHKPHQRCALHFCKLFKVSIIVI